uniref:Uncharacterized protein n=1 Tax=Schistocephalus solidus TaxID=70667 RepID=A0A0X3PDY7_SCHSO
MEALLYKQNRNYENLVVTVRRIAKVVIKHLPDNSYFANKLTLNTMANQVDPHALVLSLSVTHLPTRCFCFSYCNIVLRMFPYAFSSNKRVKVSIFLGRKSCQRTSTHNR